MRKLFSNKFETFADKYYYVIFILLIIPVLYLYLRYYNADELTLGKVLLSLFASVCCAWMIYTMCFYLWMMLTGIFIRIRLIRSGPQLAFLIVLSLLIWGGISANSSVENSINAKNKYPNRDTHETQSQSNIRNKPSQIEKHEDKLNKEEKKGIFRIGAICRDGSESDATGRGACSHHGGVRYWLMSDGTKQPR